MHKVVSKNIVQRLVLTATMNTFFVLFIAAVLAMASGAPPNNKQVTKVFSQNKENGMIWQIIEHLDKNIDNEYLNPIISTIFYIFAYQPEELLRMQELVSYLDAHPELKTMCPAGNRWSIFGFKLCTKDYIFGSPQGRYFVLHYTSEQELDGAGYALYNDCK